MQYIRLLWSLLDSRARRKFILLIILTTLSGFVEILSVGLIIPFVALATNSLPFGQANRWTQSLVDLVRSFGVAQHQVPAALGIVFLLGVIVANSYICCYQYYAALLISQQRADFSVRVIRELSSRPIEQIDVANSSDSIKLVLTDVGYVGQGIYASVQVAAVVARCAIVYCFFLVAQFKMAITLAFSLGLLYQLVFRYIQRPIIRAGEKDQDSAAKMFRSASELLGGARAVRATASEDYFIKRFQNAADSSVQTQVIRMMPTHFTRAGLETATIGAVVALLVYFNWKDGNLANGLPLMSSYAVAGIRLLPAVQQSINFLLEIKFYAPCVRNLAQVLKPDGVEPKSIVTVDDPIATGAIVMNGVYYSYVAGRQTICDVSLKIEPNSRVAFVGETGAGKSTLADLVMALRFPQSGEFRVGEKLITPENAHVWRRSIGYVPQTIYLLDDTLVSNIAFGVPPDKVNLERVTEACENARIMEFIKSLPAGLETNVGERGVKLSGGQKQRIGIARALYNDPGVIVFDEATSALDTATENSVLEALDVLKGSKTLIVVAHRLNTIWDFDVIYVLDNGRIVAQGKSRELLDTSPIFAQLASHQLNVS